MPRVTVLTRRGCHLCEDALGVVERVCSDLGASWHARDVDADPALRAEHSDHVPVTLVDGLVFSRWFLDAEELRARLSGGSGG